MLRDRETISDIIINWFIMLLIICPLVSVSMLGIFWIIFKILGAV